MIQHYIWQMKCQATSTLLDENMTCEFKCKNSFTLSKLSVKTEPFLLTVKQSLLTAELKKLTTKQKKSSLQFWCGFFKWLQNAELCALF